jgi:hypothetical protein
MGSAEWNLNPLDIATFQFHQIRLYPAVLEDSELTSDRRLLIIAHSLSFHGVPAFFLQESPPYIHPFVLGSVVIAFDLWGAFQSFEISDAFTIVSHSYSCSAPFDGVFYEHLQRALILESYYVYRDLKPLYFTSYLLFPGTASLSDPFLFQRIPIRRNGSLCIRTTLKGSLDFVLECHQPVPVGSFVLVPPHEHPYSVVGCSSDVLSLVSVEKETLTLSFQDSVFVLLTRPTVLMPNFYRVETPGKLFSAKDRRLCHFPTDDFYSFPSEHVDGFLASRFAMDSPPQATAASADWDRSIEFPELSVCQILSQMIRDANERAAIFANLGVGCGFPSRRCTTVTISCASFLSFFRFDFGFSVVHPPFHAQPMITGQPCRFDRLGIPRVLVARRGAAIEVAANLVVDDWESHRYQPVSGSKSGHFIVVYAKGIRLDETKTFFTEFRHLYRQLQFGELSPFPRFNAFYEVAMDGVPAFLSRFFADQCLSEYQQYPVLTFIVGPQIFDLDFKPHSIISYVRPESVSAASSDEIKTFAFIVYSRIRVFAPCPFGMINIAPNDSAALFFGFRYQPPFVLRRRSSSELTLHVAWDSNGRASAWIDDAGSALHFFPMMPLPKLAEVMTDAVRLLVGVSVRFTVSVLGVGISRELLGSLRASFNGLNVLIFAVNPEPAVQVIFRDAFDDDAVIFGDQEQFREGDERVFQEADACCYVVARSLPAYSASLYLDKPGKKAKELLLEFVRDMSHLSWLSVKPGSELRTISLPPQVVALLRKITPPCSLLSRYEFLPSIERI